MSIEPIKRLRRTARIPYSPHPAAQLRRIWHRVAGDPAPDEGQLADVLMLPLAGLALSLFLLGLPGTSDAIAAACAVACMP